MKLRFTIHYTTVWGQSLHIVLTTRSRDGRERVQNIAMSTDDGDLWVAETTVMESRRHPVTSLSYRYQVEGGDGEVLRREWSMIPREYTCDSSKNYVFPDSWRDIPLQYHLYTWAVIRGEKRETVQAPLARQSKQEVGVDRQLPVFRKTLVLRVSAPQLHHGESLAVCGNHPSLGDWNPSRYLRMSPIGDGDWVLSVNVDNVRLPLEYKYVVIDDGKNVLKSWEEGDNRVIGAADVGLFTEQNAVLRDGEVVVVYGGVLRVKEQTWRAAGVAVPLFSLRTEQSFGVGDLGDLMRLGDWVSLTGMKLIQLLPLNDTTSTHSWTDSHPYNVISTHALHPHYLDLEQLPALKDRQERGAMNRQRRELNAQADSDYMAVDRVKWDYINKVYREHGDEILRSEGFAEFWQQNAAWMMPYAAFCALRDHFGTARTADWQQYAAYDEEVVSGLSNEGSPLCDDIRRTYFVQYELYTQLRRAVDYLHSLGIAVKCDLPVSTCRDSVETWTHPEWFRLDMQLGTPPSSSEPMGQNWGLPPVSDAGMAMRMEALRHLEQFFDAVRIDHVVGMFRTWEIPIGSLYASMGHFAPALPLSEEEIGRYGLAFRKELFTRPFINDQILDRLFGIHAQYVRETFLVRRPYGLYDLRDEVGTQVRIRHRFDGQNDENSQWIRDGLYQLCADVLFLEDAAQPGMYHPRFGVLNAPVCEVLGAEEKRAFMNLYNDYFFVRHNDYWRYKAQEKVEAIVSASRMLVCAEDLGLLPPCVDEVLDQWRVLTLEVQSMPKTAGYEFSHLSANPCRSVATFSTHDMASMRLWWEEFPGRTQRYYATMLQKEGRAPQHLPAHLAEEIVARHLYCPSMLCVLSLQDWLAMSSELRGKDVWAERINDPYDAYHRWRYRMAVSLEQLMEARQYNEKVKTMIVRSKRGEDER